MARFCIFNVLSFELNFFFNRSFPLKLLQSDVINNKIND